jgi:hypothetical protein
VTGEVPAGEVTANTADYSTEAAKRPLMLDWNLITLTVALQYLLIVLSISSPVD